jgi:hypothetical protein
VVDVPLLLWNQPHWELLGRMDSVRFFRHLAEALPGATTVFLEGTCIAPETDAILRSLSEPGEYLPEPQTLWPKARQYRLPFDAATMGVLAELMEKYAEPEVLEHLFLYRESSILLEFPDAFLRGCPVLISSECDEGRLREFAAKLGTKVTLQRCLW